jgi:hypothetical protein
LYTDCGVETSSVAMFLLYLKMVKRFTEKCNRK